MILLIEKCCLVFADIGCPMIDAEIPNGDFKMIKNVSTWEECGIYLYLQSSI